MEFKNEHIVIAIIIIITIFFIINYDVYVLPKNEPLCKPVYVTKKIIDDKIIKKLKNPKESFKSLKNNKINEHKINEHKNIKEENLNIKEENILMDDNMNNNMDDNKNNNMNNHMNNHPENLSKIKEENINHNKNIIRKKIILNNILNILPKIPTKLNNEEIHFIINHISNIYLTSTTMNQFYNNVNNSDKISSTNSSYVRLILYLIDNFDSSIPIDIDQVNANIENKKIIKNNNKDEDDMFLIANSNSPIQNRMLQQASFIH
jgi:hypothetical protein